MGVAVARRLVLGAMAGAGAALVCALAAAPAAPASPGDELLPDLVTLRTTDLSISKKGSHTKLRLTNTVANRADAAKAPAGPLEIYPGQPGTGTCGQDRQPAFQRVFLDSAESPGYFLREDDTQSAPDNAAVGCMAFHRSHNHWHFRDFALYELRHERSGKLAARSTDARGKKMSFCVIDSLSAFAGLLGSPEQTFYGGASCSCPPSGCGPLAAQGLSIGYGDVYVAGLPGQRIIIDGLRRGRYCLTSTADPSGLLRESEEDNNARERRIVLLPGRGKVRRRPGPCRLG